MPHTFTPISFVSDFAHIIDGQKGGSTSTLTIENPVTRAPLATVPRATKDEVDATVAAAHAAFPGWAATPWEERQAAVAKLGDLCAQFMQELAVLLTKETGKPVKTVSEWELGGSMAWFRGVAEQELKEEVIETPGCVFTQRHTPLGVGVAIVPWNYPMILMALKVAPGLLSGNTVIIKPAPTTPLTTLKFCELAQQVLPPGVLSVLSGGDELGPWLTAHPGVAMVAFTGSTPTGQAVMRSAAANMKRVTLELGGNDAAIVLPDVDVDKLAPQLFWAMFTNAGQVCVAAKRVFVHADVYDRLRDALLSIARSVRIGDGLDIATQLGPLQNEAQFRRVQELVKDCESKGMRMLTGGVVDKGLKGYFMPVTLVDNPPEDSRIVLEEPFGPIAPLLKWSDEDDVVRRANDSEFGLAATVWGADLARADRIARRLDAGTIWVNQWLQLHPLMAFGGHKMSGMGVEGSLGGLNCWMNTQVVSSNRDESVFRRDGVVNGHI